MSHFLSFEPLIIPVSMHLGLLPRCCLALDETLVTTLLLTLTRSRMTTLQEEEEEEKEHKHPVISKVSSLTHDPWPNTLFRVPFLLLSISL
jgi:hypothetical protein